MLNYYIVSQNQTWNSLAEITTRLKKKYQAAGTQEWDYTTKPRELIFLDSRDVMLFDFHSHAKLLENAQIRVYIDGSMIFQSPFKVIVSTLSPFQVTWICYSKTHANLLRRMLKVRSSAIASLDRSHLFLRLPEKIKCTDPRRTCYLGRLAKDKNIEELISKSLEWGMIPELYGKDYPFPDHSYAEDFSYKLDLELKEKYWKENLPFERTDSVWDGGNIFASFSYSIFEDVGISALKAIENGVPVLLSQWGGHRDFTDVAPGMVLLDANNKSREEVMLFLNNVKIPNVSLPISAPSFGPGEYCQGMTALAYEFIYNKNFCLGPDFNKLINRYFLADE